MARILDLVSTSAATEDSVVVVTDLESSKKITISDLRNTLVKRASSTVSGTIKVGSGLRIDESGVVSVTNFSGYSLPPATTSTLGGVIIGTGLAINSQGVVTVDIPPSPRASTTTFGVVRVGSGLAVSNGVISNAITLPPSFLIEGGQTIDEDFTTENNKEFYSIAPITIARNVTFTISSNSTWVLYTPSAAPFDEQKISYFQEGNRSILSNLTIEDNKEIYSLGTITISNNATLTVEKNSTWILYDVIRLEAPPAPTPVPAAIQESLNMITSNYTIANDRTATSYGPITMDQDVTVEIPPLSTWIIF